MLYASRTKSKFEYLYTEMYVAAVFFCKYEFLLWKISFFLFIDFF